MCNFGGDDQTKAVTNTDSSQRYTPTGADTFWDIINRSQDVSNRPFKPVTRGVAGLTGTQKNAMEMLGSNPWQTYVSPYMTQAADLFQSAAQPLTGEDINQYYNPMSDAVMANLQEVFGAQRRDTTGKLTSAAGGVGADRVAVGQSELARQQGLAGGQTMASLWQNALNAAQAQQGIEQASAYGLGNLAATNIGTALQSASAMFGMGSAQQAVNQAKKDARYQKEMMRYAYPFQAAQWYAGMALPAAGALGGTTTGTQGGTQTVDPADPNFWSQLAGVGLTAAGMFAKRGGRIKGYAMGGSPYGGGEESYVPAMQAPPPMAQQQQGGMPSLALTPLDFLDAAPGGQTGGVGGKGSSVYKEAGQGLNNIFGSEEGDMGWSTKTMPTLAGLGNYLGFASGGRIEENEPFEILSKIARGKGGQIQGYADGGSPFGGSALSASPELVRERLMALGLVPESPAPPPFAGVDVPKSSTIAPLSNFTNVPKSGPVVGSVPGFATTNMTEGPAPAPFVPKTGFDGAGNPVTQPPPLVGDPSWKPVAGEETGPHEIPAGEEGPWTDASWGADTQAEIPPEGGAPARGIISPMQDQGPLQATGEGRWAQAFAAGMPQMFERPTLFGRPLTNTRLALMAAGLGMLGGESPYFGVNVGQGGLQGLKTLHDFQQLDAQRQAMALNRMLEAGRLDAQEGAYRVTAADKFADNLRQLDFAVRAGYMDPKDAQRIASEMAKSYKESGMTSQDASIPDFAGQGKVDIDSFPDPIFPEGVNPEFAVDVDASLEGIEDTDRFTRGLQTSKGAEVAATESKDILAKSAEASAGAKDVIGNAYETNRYLDKLPQDGLLTPGTGFDVRVGIARLANTLARATSLYGDKTEYTLEQATKDIGTAESLQKLQTYAGFGLARTLGTREALQVIQQALAAVAGGQMTPAGAKNIIYSVIAAQSRHPERHRFLQGFGRRSRYNNVLGADEFFDKVAPIDKYTRRLELLKRFDAARRKATPEQLEALKQESWDVYRIKPEMWGGF